MRLFQTFVLFTICSICHGQPLKSTSADKWVDSVYRSLGNDERIAQLMVVRLSSLDVKNNRVTFYDKQVSDLINKYNIGAICLFQGDPTVQAGMINSFQKIARTPLMVCIDAEWGVGQRFLDSVLPLPKQMMLGAMKDASLMRQYGKIVAEQCKRLGIHVNYAPVADVNNNPANPVINDRSFGEDKYKVAEFATEYMKGMQENGIMACAKHFPGHGDVVADSHYDLPVINKSKTQLDSLELYPFRILIREGVESAMMAHLFIPAIESRTNMATSLSSNNVTRLLRREMNFKGLTFTDALDMQAVQKFFPNGESSVESLIAGNDMLCLPADVPLSITRIKEAISQKRLSWDDIELHCKKVLHAKYEFVLPNIGPVNTVGIIADLNKQVNDMRRKVAEQSITLLAKKDTSFFPLEKSVNDETAYVGLGLKKENNFSRRMREDFNATVYYIDILTTDSLKMRALADSILKKHKKIIIGIHNINRRPANNFDIGKTAIQFTKDIQQAAPTMIWLFGNAYAAANWCEAKNLAVCYEDDEVVQATAADLLGGKLPYKGSLPVTICEKYKYGGGLTADNSTWNEDLAARRFDRIDSIARDAIKRKAIPGCVILIRKNGNTVYEKAFGHYTYSGNDTVSTSTIYDLASITKICATTLSIMKLYDEGKIDLEKSICHYLPDLYKTNKDLLPVKDILLHQAGITAYIPFFKETLNKDGSPSKFFYSSLPNNEYCVPVADHLYLRNDWPSCMMEKIASMPVGEKKYVYSDNDFILLGKLVETISGLSLSEYVSKNFYEPMGLNSIGYLPRQRFPVGQIAPTENEIMFRSQLLHGFVHDPGAAMFGGVAGHAGLFSNAPDLGAIMQMLLNGGVYHGRRFLEEATIKLFTSYNSTISRRGLGFDKPEKENKKGSEPYPAASASLSTFGHTGYTGTAVWADPENDLLFVFLSNRVFPDGNSTLNKLNVRGKILEEAYRAFSIK